MAALRCEKSSVWRAPSAGTCSPDGCQGTCARRRSLMRPVRAESTATWRDRSCADRTRGPAPSSAGAGWAAGETRGSQRARAHASREPELCRSVRAARRRLGQGGQQKCGHSSPRKKASILRQGSGNRPAESAGSAEGKGWELKTRWRNPRSSDVLQKGAEQTAAPP